MRPFICLILVLLSALTLLGQDSLNVSQIGSFHIWNYADDVAVAGNHAYMATGTTGLQIFDISNLSDPHQVGYLELPRSCSALIVVEPLIFITDCDWTCWIVDVQNPAAPQLLGEYVVQSGRIGTDMAVIGNLLILADTGNHQLLILDMTNPTAPTLRGQLDTPLIDSGVAVHDSIAYYETNGNGLHVVDLHNPAAPQEIGASPNVGEISNLVIQGHYAYVSGADADSVHVIDIANPVSPAVVAGYRSGEGYQHLTINESRLYVAFRDSLQIVDISNPLQPVRMASFPHICSPQVSGWTSVAASGNAVFLGTPANELLIVDASQPNAPVQIGRFDASTASQLMAATTYGHYLCVPFNGVPYHGGMLVMDVSDPARMFPATVLAGDPASAVTARSQTVFLASMYCDTLSCSAALVTCDMANPLSPQPLGWAPLIDYPSHIAMSDRYIYATHMIQHLSIVDEQDPVHPVTVSQLLLPEFGLDVAVSDSLLVIGTTTGVEIRRVFSPDSLPVIGNILESYYVWSLAVEENLVLASASDDSFYVVNIADASAPVILGSCPAPFSSNIEVRGNLAYLAGDTAGLRIIDIADQAHPHEVGYYRTGKRIVDVAIGDSVIFAVSDEGIGAFQYLEHVGIHTPTGATLPFDPSLSAYPNPFNPTTALSFDIPQPGRVQIAVYDLTGRLVEKLADKSYAQGNYHLTFDGSDLPSGIYFARFHGPSYTKTQKLVLLK
jgi:hypothetical protein